MLCLERRHLQPSVAESMNEYVVTVDASRSTVIIRSSRSRRCSDRHKGRSSETRSEQKACNNGAAATEDHSDETVKLAANPIIAGVVPAAAAASVIPASPINAPMFSSAASILLNNAIKPALQLVQL